MTVLEALPDVLNHNMETIARLYRRVRPDANYQQSLTLLERAAKWRDKFPAFDANEKRNYGRAW